VNEDLVGRLARGVAQITAEVRAADLAAHPSALAPRPSHLAARPSQPK
jgi:hypothetical protein